jgi:hypothetical protein
VPLQHSAPGIIEMHQLAAHMGLFEQETL